MRRPLFLPFVLVLAGLSAAAGCRRHPAAAKAAGASGSHVLVVGFAQTGDESAWRTANTLSIKSEAQKRGIDLKFADGEGRQENQIRAVRSFIAQGVDVIVIDPIVVTGWEPVLLEAKRAKIPVIITDRQIQVSDPSLYACFIGSDFMREGRLVGDWLAKQMHGQARIIELEGTPGSAPAIERKQAFADAIAAFPGMKIIDSQSGDFRRSKGKEVMAALLKTHGRDFNAVFAQNDDMALGAIQAIEEAGLRPGKDITIVSIDGLKEALQAIVAGKLNCCVECNPMFGPKVFDAAARLAAGEPVPRVVYNHDELFDSGNAAQFVNQRRY